ncbi:hypothetical protein [Thermomonospora cellulosilytica]|uniref:Uncharacterized protein n=1 Tax=Thermomonospora cellulosilytica TaxID=1411118 RepID=A0A7W3MZZ1_9ACTN|nr:hypothetical protein [Thermomonospora cellulosilytica]MBA9005007.1 hypothetical protein [Thermomonospora cellulosilytica]
MTTPAARIEALAVHLKAHGYEVEPMSCCLAVRNPDPKGPLASDVLTCRPHEEDDGRLWFFTLSGDPVSEADNLTDALVWLKGHLGSRP